MRTGGKGIIDALEPLIPIRASYIDELTKNILESLVKLLCKSISLWVIGGCSQPPNCNQIKHIQE